MKLISISENTKQNIKKNIKDYLKGDKVALMASLFAALVLVLGNSITARADKKLAEANVLLEEIEREEEEERKERMAKVLSQLAEEDVNNTNDDIEVIDQSNILNNIANIDDKTLDMLAKRINAYLKSNLAKKESLEGIIGEAFKETVSDGVAILDDSVNAIEEGITINNFDKASIEEKMAFICEKYNLTDFELKVVISVVFHEAGWYYDDAFKVATVIYNRTKSKENIRYNHYLTKLDGESLYSQVIATGYTKDGDKVQQFDGYLPNQAGYDFDSILESDNDLLKTNALLDCLILLKLGEEYENPTFPFAPCFSMTCFWGDGRRNHFSKPVVAGDVVDNYSFPENEYDCEFTREDVINMAKEYVISAKKKS